MVERSKCPNCGRSSVESGPVYARCKECRWQMSTELWRKFEALKKKWMKEGLLDEKEENKTSTTT